MKTLLNPNQRGFKTTIEWLVLDHHVIVAVKIKGQEIPVVSHQQFCEFYEQIDQDQVLNTRLLSPKFVTNKPPKLEEPKADVSPFEPSKTDKCLLLHVNQHDEVISEYESDNDNFDSLVACIKKRVSTGSIIQVVESKTPSPKVFESFYRLEAHDDYGFVKFKMDFDDQKAASNKQIMLQEKKLNTKMQKIYHIEINRCVL